MKSVTLTFPQRKALGGLRSSSTNRLTAKNLAVRSDVLWRLEERGYVGRTNDQWYVTSAGIAAYEAAMRQLGASR